jgi:hypothetical protein
MFEAYGPLMNALNFAPPDPAIVGERGDDIWRERLERSSPWTLGYLRNLLDGPYWRDRSVAPDYGRVSCPVLLVGGWADWYPSAELRAFQHLTAPRKVLIGPWGHSYPEEGRTCPGPRIDGRREYLKWFDRWLKDIDNGVTDEPPVTVFVRRWQTPSLLCLEEPGEWRGEAAWPPSHVRMSEFLLGGDGRLGAAPQDGSDSYEYRPSVGVAAGRCGLGVTAPWGMPLDQRSDDAYSLVYDTAPLTETMELIGEPQALLHVSSTAEIAYFHVRLCEVAPDGASRLISAGGLLATHRTSHDRPQPLEPGQIYELRFPLRHCAYALTPGNRLRVAVASAEFQNAWPTGVRARNTVFWGPRYPSGVVLPIADPNRAAPPPRFEDSPIAALRGAPAPTYAMHHDLVADTVTCEIANVDQNEHNVSRYTVSNLDPATTVIESSCRYRPQRAAKATQIDATCRTSSDATQYSHSSRVEIRVDGQLQFDKSWTEIVPRNWS